MKDLCKVVLIRTRDTTVSSWSLKINGKNKKAIPKLTIVINV
jgi:hypothetical protein